MRNAWRSVVALTGLVLILGWQAFANPVPKEKTRNPFDVPDIDNVNDQAVKDYAATVQLPGDANDANAKQWVPEVTAGKANSLDGDWYGRWNAGPGTDWQNGIGVAKIRAIGDRVFILFRDHQGQFLIEGVRTKNRLAGRWQGIDNPNDTGPCAFAIVDDERIDGDWNNAGRWDFRRKRK
jgi:hypothetical protein